MYLLTNVIRSCLQKSMPKMKKTAAAYCKRLEEEAMEVEFT